MAIYILMIPLKMSIELMVMMRTVMMMMRRRMV